MSYLALLILEPFFWLREPLYVPFSQKNIPQLCNSSYLTMPAVAMATDKTCDRDRPGDLATKKQSG